MDMLQSNWTNPFTNLDLGQYFIGAVTKDLLQAKDIGLATYTSFHEERLVNNEKGFYGL